MKFIFSVLKNIFVYTIAFTFLFFVSFMGMASLLIVFVSVVPGGSLKDTIILALELFFPFTLFSIEAGSILGLFYGTIKHYVDNHKKS
ncbi:MAG: hypothetical protein BGO78_14045 [Chloroflexi bacterium 44-23]|nr:MAG: hypothetical protein BGO78_14045 [Chloroflexi bacterium 44-23]